MLLLGSWVGSEAGRRCRQWLGRRHRGSGRQCPRLPSRIRGRHVARCVAIASSSQYLAGHLRAVLGLVLVLLLADPLRLNQDSRVMGTLLYLVPSVFA